ncbi:type IV secretion system protein TrbF [Gammaproteobacteria bacterium]
MKNPFKKEVANYKGDEPITPYQRAQQEWDLRIGSSRAQARNWRICTFFSLLIAIALAWGLVFVLTSHKEKIFIAQVTTEGRVVNVSPLVVRYQPNEAQKEYFITHFIELVRTLTLDPVAVKQNWINAYSFLSSRGGERFNTYFKENNLVSLLGKKTITLQITDINPVSTNTMHVRWTETTINTNGQEEGKKNYSGIFTIVTKQPTTREEILRNPLGIYIVDFNVSTPK